MIKRSWCIVFLLLLILLFPTHTFAQGLPICEYGFIEALPHSVLALNFPHEPYFSVYHGGIYYSGYGHPVADYSEFSLPEGVELAEGDYIHVDGVDCYRETYFKYLQPDVFYPRQTTVSGWARSGDTVIIRLDFIGFEDKSVVADSAGRWSFDLTELYGLTPGDIDDNFAYEVLVPDETDNDATLYIVASYSE